MADKTMWANIICDEDGEPTKVIVTNGDVVAEIPVSRTKIRVVKKMCMDIYDVPPNHILTNVVLKGDKEEGK